MTHSATASSHPRQPEPTARPHRSGSTTPRSSTTRAASPSSRAWTAIPSHETIERALTRAREPRAPRRRRRRPAHRRRRRDAAAAAGRVLPRRDRARSCRPPGAYGVASASCRATTRRAGPSSSSSSRRAVEEEGQRVDLLARRAGRARARSATTAREAAPRRPAAPRRRLGRARGRPRRLRAQALRDPPRRRDRAPGPTLVIPSFSARTIVYKGMLMAPQLARLLPRPARRADEERARARPLALLDQHLPELGARAPVPDDRPQRRDQHRARQRQLDARARVAARLRALRRRPRARCCRSSAPAARTRRTSTTCSSCSCSRAARCRTR